MATLSYLGPAGTFTEEAARRYDPSAELLPFATITAAANAVHDGAADKTVSPVENSLQGSITETLDLLIHDDIRICGEVVIPVVHNLVAKAGVRKSDIRIVYSHPQALGQCQRYLEQNLPGVELAAALSTASAVEQAVAAGGHAAAISTLRAMELYGASLIEAAIHDSANNVTRFVVLAMQDAPQTGDDKTSICFSFSEDKPGQLYAVMGEFANNAINLTKVESRPTRMGLGQYYFLIDLEGHRLDGRVKATLDRVARMTSELKVFGSYPRFANGV